MHLEPFTTPYFSSQVLGIKWLAPSAKSNPTHSLFPTQIASGRILELKFKLSVLIVLTKYFYLNAHMCLCAVCSQWWEQGVRCLEVMCVHARVFGGAETRCSSSATFFLNPLFSKHLNQPVNELRDRCLHLILTACISGEYREEKKKIRCRGEEGWDKYNTTLSRNVPLYVPRT